MTGLIADGTTIACADKQATPAQTSSGPEITRSAKIVDMARYLVVGYTEESYKWGGIYDSCTIATSIFSITVFLLGFGLG